MSESHLGGTTVPVVIDQAGPGTTELLAASPGYKYVVINYTLTLDAAGTFAFSDGVAWLTGDIPVAANGGASTGNATQQYPHFSTGVGRPLSITTTGGGASGHMLVRKV